MKRPLPTFAMIFAVVVALAIFYYFTFIAQVEDASARGWGLVFLVLAIPGAVLLIIFVWSLFIPRIKPDPSAPKPKQKSWYLWS